MGNATELRRQNIINILKTIQSNDKITKNQIAVILKLSSVTVHNIVNLMSDIDLCIDSGEYISHGGRNAVLYKINGKFGYVIGQQIFRDGVETTVYDLNVNKVYQNKVECNLNDIEQCTDIMVSQIKEATSSVGDKKYIGAGVSLPGRVKKNGSVINLPDYPMWRNIPLKERMEEEFGFPFYIDNDNNALALSSKWSKLTGNYSNFVYLSVSDGVGIGTFINGNLFYGANDHGCELGHTSIMLDGPVCKCGNKGCIEALTNNQYILSKINDYLIESGKAPINDMETAIDYAKEGNIEALRGFNEAAEYIAVTIEHIVKIFDPDMVVVQNIWLGSMPDILSEIKEKVFEKCTWLKKDKFKIIINNDEKIITQAPACLVFEKLYLSSDDNVILDIIDSISPQEDVEFK